MGSCTGGQEKRSLGSRSQVKKLKGGIWGGGRGGEKAR